jgi:hypothetical protein
MSLTELENRTTVTSGRCRVRVWFGQYAIADYTAEPAVAERYAAAMARRFAGCRVTVEPCAVPTDGRLLPPEQLWTCLPL